MTLQERRAEWEKGLTPLCVINQAFLQGRVLVVTDSFDIKLYCLFRYFQVGESWECSADLQNATLTAIFNQLSKECSEVDVP